MPNVTKVKVDSFRYMGACTVFCSTVLVLPFFSSGRLIGPNQRQDPRKPEMIEPESMATKLSVLLTELWA